MSRREGVPGGRAPGFTLLEVVTAVFIFLLGIVGVISLFTAGTMLHRGARNKARVALAVPWVIQRIEQRLDEAARDGAGLPDMLEEVVPGFAPFRYRAVLGRTGTDGEGGAILAEVRILWKEKGRERGEEFDWIFRPGPSEVETVSAFRSEVKSSAAPSGEDR